MGAEMISGSVYFEVPAEDAEDLAVLRARIPESIRIIESRADAATAIQAVLILGTVSLSAFKAWLIARGEAAKYTKVTVGHRILTGYSRKDAGEILRVLDSLGEHGVGDGDGDGDGAS
jgi:hypothetical protein